MRTIDLTKKFKELGLNNIYPNNIPVEYPSGVTSMTGVYEYSNEMQKYNTSGILRLQFLTVANEPNDCQLRANEIRTWLLNNNLWGTVLGGDTELLDIVLMQKPFYVGVDEQKRYQFSFNVEWQIKEFN